MEFFLKNQGFEFIMSQMTNKKSHYKATTNRIKADNEYLGKMNKLES